MNDNIQKVILMGASILMTIGIITISVRVFKTANNIVEESEKEMVVTHSKLKNNKYSIYDNKQCTGYDVLNAIKTSGTSAINIDVKTGEGNLITYNKENEYTINDETNINYINPLGEFKGELEYNSNGIISNIKFEQI